MFLRSALGGLGQYSGDEMYVPGLAAGQLPALRVPHGPRAFTRSVEVRQRLPTSPSCIDTPRITARRPHACISLSSRRRAGVPYRDPSFLESPQLAAALRAAVDVRVLPREQYHALPSAARARALPLGTRATEAAAALAQHDGATLLRLEHARGLLCELGSGEGERTFNSLAAAVLRVPDWCTRCHQGCAKQLREWLGPQDIGRAAGQQWCLRLPPPPAFEPGRCVLNVAGDVR